MQNSLSLAQEAQNTQLKELKAKIEGLAADNSVLRCLYFDEIYNRADTITDATDGTFDWLLPNEPASPSANTLVRTSGRYGAGTVEDLPGILDDLPGILKDSPGLLEEFHVILEDLLEFDERQICQQNAAKISIFFEQSSGVLFMRGKPGSGKSTLMKHLTGGRGQQKVHQKLRKWAGQKKLVCISTMFLLHGTPFQRSLEGFYRAFFFELLCQCPEFVEILFPKYPAQELANDPYKSSFSLKTLRDAWERFTTTKNYTALRICLFIDGIDELEGNSLDRLEFARALRDWAQSDDVKIICSGRPNAELNIVFNQPQRRIDLQDCTKMDIRKILWKRFQGIRQFRDLTEDDLKALVNIISVQSEGVILWAVLVGKNIEEDIIHGQSFDAMKRTIQTLPRGIEDFFDAMWEDLRHDEHQQRMLRTIYDLLVLTNEKIWSWRRRPKIPALSLFWLEDALSDDEFPYNEPMQALPEEKLKSRFDTARDRLVQYTRHLVEVTTGAASLDDGRCVSGSCRFVHRSAQEFIHEKLGAIGTVSAPSDHTFELYLRLQIIFRISVARVGMVTQFADSNLHFVFDLLSSYNKKYYNQMWNPCGMEQQVYQVPYRMMQKVHELTSAPCRSLLKIPPGHEDWNYVWRRMKLSSDISMGELSLNKSVGAYSFFHLALESHQVDYVTRVLTDRTQQLDREALNLGLLVCVAGKWPSFELFDLLVKHGADPGSLVEVYPPGRDSSPDLIPLWILFCCSLAVKQGTLRVFLGKKLKDEFLILERLLRLGFAFNVRLLTVLPDGSLLTVLPDGSLNHDKDNLTAIDLAQFVRIAKPDNLDRLLCLLEPPIAACFSSLQRLTNWALHPASPVRTPFIWEVCSVFDGKHEIRAGSQYYIPWVS